MARRPIFLPLKGDVRFVDEVLVDFEWNPGFAPTQKKKNIDALHEAASARGLDPLLEVSTKSEERLGRRLSAFSLQVDTHVGKISLESAYQGSKVFENGGPYHDLYHQDSRSAKRDPRIRESGSLIHFNYFGEVWPRTPKTAFYDWLYIGALSRHTDFLRESLCRYRGFTDIEFNPEKSVNCQARSCALLVALINDDLLGVARESQQSFIDLVSRDSIAQAHSADLQQRRLI